MSTRASTWVPQTWSSTSPTTAPARSLTPHPSTKSVCLSQMAPNQLNKPSYKTFTKTQPNSREIPQLRLRGYTKKNWWWKTLTNLETVINRWEVSRAWYLQALEKWGTLCQARRLLVTKKVNRMWWWQPTAYRSPKAKSDIKLTTMITDRSPCRHWCLKTQSRCIKLAITSLTQSTQGTLRIKSSLLTHLVDQERQEALRGPVK